MRRNLLKRKIALGLSLLMLGSSEGVQVLAESVERESTVQAEESAWEESSALEVYNENTEAETEEKYLETSEQITELDEPKSGIEETTHQENTTVETIEREAEATTMEIATAVEAEYTSGDEQNSAEQNSNELSSEAMSSTEVETELSSETTSSAELETELSSEATFETETYTELESEVESEYESETEELMSEEETEGDAYLADTLVYGDFNYRVEENGEAVIVGYNCTEKNKEVIIPDVIEGHVVTSVGSFCFWYKGITSVEIPDSVVEIRDNAFLGCTQLKKIILSKNLVRIGKYAFANTDLAEIVIPGSVVNIEDYTFKNCTKLNEVILSDNIITIGVQAFYGCGNLTSLRLPSNLKKMGTQMIKGTKIESIVVPKGVYEAGYAGINEVSGALEGCNTLTTVILEEGMETIPKYLFANINSLQKVEIPQSIKKIDNFAFHNCTGLKEIIIPKSVVDIGEYVFCNCTSLTKVTFEEQSLIKKIPREMFKGCISLETVELSKEITNIDWWAFQECKSLKNIVFPSSLQTIDREAFKNSGLEYVAIPANVYSIGSEAFARTPIKEVYFEKGKKVQIGIAAFKNCTILTNFFTNNRLIELEEEALSGCSSLVELDLSSVLKLGPCVVGGTQIRKLIIPTNTMLNGKYAYGRTYYSPFTGCDTLKTIILQDGRSWITNYAFSSCESIESIVIPASVNEFSTFAFWEQGNKNLIIYGVSGSYTEEWAKRHNYQFRDVSEGFEDSYKTSEYLIKVIDSASKQPISNAAICINGEEAGITAEDGTVKITIYGTVTQNVSVAKAGYDTRSYIGMPWNSTEQNVVELAIQEKTIEKQITDMLPDAKLPETTLNGPKINIFGKEIYLFSLPISVDVNWFDNVSIKYDNETQTAKVMIGVKETVKKDFETGKDGEKQYQNMKNFVKSCGEGTNQADMLNKFKDTKDGLAPMKGKVAFGVSGNIAGFIELKYNNGQWNLLDGGLVAVLSASVSQKIPLCYIFYAEFGLSGSVTGTIKLTLDNQKQYQILGSIALGIAPSIAVGANALIVDVKGGFEGGLTGTLKFPAQTMEEAFEAYMSGKLFLKVSSPIPFYTASFNWQLFKIELFPDFGANLDPVEWKMAIEDRAVPANGQAYEYADTQTVTLSDGRSVMVYITDDGTKSTGNHTTLVYSVYENGTWSAAKPVCETGRADVKPVLKADGDKAYVVWMNIGKVISESSTPEEIYQSTDLWLSEFDGAAFKEPERVPVEGNAKMEFSYDISAVNGTAAVVWIENSDNDPFMQTGTNTIYSRQRVNGIWQDIQTMTTSEVQIGALQAAITADSLSVQYSDGTNVYQASGQAVVQTGLGTNVKVFDGVTYYIRENQLYQLAQDGTETACGIACSSDYQVYDKVVYWTQQMNFNSELYMQKLGESNAVQLTYDGGYISSFAIYTMENGTTSITYTWTEVLSDDELEEPYGVTYTKTIQGTTVYDLACSGPYFSAADIVPETEATFEVKIQNLSSENVDHIFMRVKDETEAVLMDNEVLKTIAAGTEKEVSFTYGLPKELSGKTLTVEIYTNEVTESDITNNTCSYTFADTDLSVVVKSKQVVIVSNHGYSDAKDVVLEIRNGSANGATVCRKEFGMLEAGTSVEVEYEIPQEFLAFKPGESAKEFIAVVTTSTSEALFGDNEAVIRIESPHIEGIELDQTKAMLQPGNTLQLQATLSGEEAVDRRVEWCSSNTDIVTVDQNGFVTALKMGQADVTAIALDGGLNAVCHVVVYDAFELNQLKFSKTKYQMISGNELTLSYVSEPVLTKEQMLTAVWGSSNEEVATVKDGIVTAFKSGSTEITVEVGGLSTTCQVEVVSPMEITGIESTAYNKLKISWTQAPEADGYTIYKKNPETGKFVVLKSIADNTVVSYTNIVTCGATYSYRVASYKLEGTKKVYLAESKIVKKTAIPSTPVLQSVNMAAYNKIRITWSKVNGCAGYVIYRSESENGTYSVLKTVTQATATNYVNIVKDSTVYYYKVRAFVTVNGKKVYGDYSSILSGNVISGSPQNFAISQASNGKITFTWNKVEDADGYVIYLYYPDTNKYKAIKNVTDIDVLTYGKKMTKGATYHFAMRAYRLVNGVKVYSDYGEIISTK